MVRVEGKRNRKGGKREWQGKVDERGDGEGEGDGRERGEDLGPPIIFNKFTPIT